MFLQLHKKKMVIYFTMETKKKKTKAKKEDKAVIKIINSSDTPFFCIMTSIFNL